MDDKFIRAHERRADAIRSCLTLFDSCLSKNRDAFADLEGEARRFRVWSNKLEAFARDTKLNAEKYVRIRRMISELLEVLKDNLSLGMVSSLHRLCEDSFRFVPKLTLTMTSLCIRSL
jgi:hypothetical protein